MRSLFIQIPNQIYWLVVVAKSHNKVSRRRKRKAVNNVIECTIHCTQKYIPKFPHWFTSHCMTCLGCHDHTEAVFTVYYWPPVTKAHVCNISPRLPTPLNSLLYI